MRISRDMLLKLAGDSVEKSVASDHSIIAAYLQGALLGDSPLLGNTADIDLFFIHVDETAVQREIIRISDEVHLDISHHAHKLYHQPRELRVHPWLGPAVYGCKILYDPQHFVDFVQASVRGQFSNSENVLCRVRKHAEHAREIWESFNNDPHPPEPQDASTYLKGLEHAANAIAGLGGQILTERRFLVDLPHRADAVDKSGLYHGFLGLLGAPAVEAKTVRAWLNDWKNTFFALPKNKAPLRLHPDRLLYYQRAIEYLIDEQTDQVALWPLWRTWTHAICALPGDTPHRLPWQKAGEQLGLLGTSFTERLQGMDAYLDTVEEIIDAWARENGG